MSDLEYHDRGDYGYQNDLERWISPKISHNNVVSKSAGANDGLGVLGYNEIEFLECNSWEAEITYYIQTEYSDDAEMFRYSKFSSDTQEPYDFQIVTETFDLSASKFPDEVEESVTNTSRDITMSKDSAMRLRKRLEDDSAAAPKKGHIGVNEDSSANGLNEDLRDISTVWLNVSQNEDFPSIDNVLFEVKTKTCGKRRLNEFKWVINDDNNEDKENESRYLKENDLLMKAKKKKRGERDKIKKVRIIKIIHI